MPNTSKVVPIATPNASPVVATKVQSSVDHPAITSAGPGNTMSVKTATGVMLASPGDYILPDSAGGYTVVPAAFYALFYKVVG